MDRIRHFPLADVTLIPEDEQAQTPPAVASGDDEPPDARHDGASIRAIETELRHDYHTAASPGTRLLVLDRWNIHLHQLRAQMTESELRHYGARVRCLVMIARAHIQYERDRIALAPQAVHDPIEPADHATPAPPIVVTAERGLLVRIIEAAIGAGIISAKTRVSQLVSTFFREPTGVNAEGHYRSHRERVGRTKTSSPAMQRFLLLLLKGCSANLRVRISNDLDRLL